MSLATEYLEVQRQLEDRGIIFSFVGYVSEGILYALGEALKRKVSLDAADANVTKRVFSVFIEQVQNIIRYSAERLDGDAPELSSGMIIVGRERGKFFVVCGNLVGEAEGAELASRLQKLCAMDKEALKAHYRQRLREPPEQDSKGASLGLIEIVRRSSEPVEFDFHAAGSGKTLFCLKAHI